MDYGVAGTTSLPEPEPICVSMDFRRGGHLQRVIISGPLRCQGPGEIRIDLLCDGVGPRATGDNSHGSVLVYLAYL